MTGLVVGNGHELHGVTRTGCADVPRGGANPETGVEARSAGGGLGGCFGARRVLQRGLFRSVRRIRLAPPISPSKRLSVCRVAIGSPDPDRVNSFSANLMPARQSFRRSFGGSAEEARHRRSRAGLRDHFSSRDRPAGGLPNLPPPHGAGRRPRHIVAAMADNPADVLVPMPAAGPVFSTGRRCRWGDLTPSGRARLDMIGAYLADIGSDDFADIGLGGEYPWLVRRSLYEVRKGARFLEDLTLHTWCSGLGLRWGERRVSITGTAGASIEAACLWVAFDTQTGQSSRLPDEYRTLRADSAGGRRVTASLLHPDPPAGDAGCTRRPWHLRVHDFDGFDHVNHAKALAFVEEVIGERPHLDQRFRCEIEYPLPAEKGCSVDLVVADQPDRSVSMWVVGAADDRQPGAVYTSARVIPLA